MADTPFDGQPDLAALHEKLVEVQQDPDKEESLDQRYGRSYRPFDPEVDCQRIPEVFPTNNDQSGKATVANSVENDDSDEGAQAAGDEQALSSDPVTQGAQGQGTQGTQDRGVKRGLPDPDLVEQHLLHVDYVFQLRRLERRKRRVYRTIQKFTEFEMLRRSGQLNNQDADDMFRGLHAELIERQGQLRATKERIDEIVEMNVN